MFIKTTALEKILKMKSRTRIVQGGSSAGKTISILEILIDIAQSNKNKVISVVSESYPHLRKGAIKDFLLILQEQGYFKDDRWNKTESTYTFETGSKIEFFSVDQPGKVRGPRRDILFINEANNISYDTYLQLSIRTSDFIYIDYNPTNSFWVHEQIIPIEKHDFIIITYKDNEALSQEIVEALEAHKNNKQFWRVYGEGLIGEIEGRIYSDWQIIDEIPHEARLERYGLDFGFSNDPTAIVAVYKYNGGYIFDEICYKKGLLNKDIADILKNQKHALVVADSAEPKSIAELNQYGVQTIGARKGKDSITHGIQVVQEQRCSLTKRSTNGIKEYRGYLWQTDTAGRFINVPEPGNDHCFAPETLVHTTDGKIKIKDLVGKEGFVYSVNGTIQKFHSVRKTRDNVKTITLWMSDGDKLTVTEDHLILKADGKWTEAVELRSMDVLQSVTYDSSNNHNNSTRFQRKKILSLRKILPKRWGEIACSCMGVSLRKNTIKDACSSHRYEQIKQPDRKSGNKNTSSTSFGSYDCRETIKGETLDRKNKAINKGMACLSRRGRVASKTWDSIIQEKNTRTKSLLSLSQGVLHASISKFGSILSPKLQDEGSNKTIVRITRGRRSKVYNLEVDNTHCFLANGVIAHNCMDAIRYSVRNLIPEEESKVAQFSGQSVLNQLMEGQP